MQPPVVSDYRNTVLVVDDQSTGRAVLEQVVRGADSSAALRSFESPTEAIEWAASHVADLVLVDYHMPDIDGITLVKRLRLLPDYAHVPIVMVTVNDSREVRYSALDAGATDFLHRPMDTRECMARCRNLMALRRQHVALENRRKLLETMVQEATAKVLHREKETLLRLARAGEFRDIDTGNHIIRMSRYSGLIAKAIGLPADQVEAIELAAPLHDIGKIGIPDHILLKPGKLTDDEITEMRRHTVIGYHIIKDSPSSYLRMGAEIALGHHEKYDGSGYPHGLVADDIPLVARVVAVADVFDALLSERPYKKAWPVDEAYAYLERQRGLHFDPRFVDAFLGVRVETRAIMQELADSTTSPRAGR